MNDDALIIGRPQVLTGPRCEIVRSFSFKLNMGNFESRDFFCSQKAECAIADAAAVSEQVYQFCKAQVLKSVREYKDDLMEAQARTASNSPIRRSA